MREERGCLYFCCAEEDSGYAIRFLHRQQGEKDLSGREKRQLAAMEKRMEESWIYLAPAVIYAVANQRSCEAWICRVEEERRREWYIKGLAWMRRYPSFLERFGWRNRKNAIVAAGILETADEGDTDGGKEALCDLLRCGWRFLWERIRHSGYLDAEGWQEMTEPWQDSESMCGGMAGVLLLMAVLLEKPVYDRDQLWCDWQRLQRFCRECLQAPKPVAAPEREDIHTEEEKFEWLFRHFKNPQRLCYIREKERFDSEWQDQITRVMRMAGLSISACETVTLSYREVKLLLRELEGRLSPQKYMTFLTVYTLAKELAQAGRAAAALDMPVLQKR